MYLHVTKLLISIQTYSIKTIQINTAHSFLLKLPQLPITYVSYSYTTTRKNLASHFKCTTKIFTMKDIVNSMEPTLFKKVPRLLHNLNFSAVQHSYWHSTFVVQHPYYSKSTTTFTSTTATRVHKPPLRTTRAQS